MEVNNYTFGNIEWTQSPSVMYIVTKAHIHIFMHIHVRTHAWEDTHIELFLQRPVPQA